MSSKTRTLWSLFIVWAVITFVISYFHAFWGDEVINLIFGIGADSQYGIHGNGHPAVWFLLLRGLYAVFHKVWVLPLASYLVAAVAVWLLIFKSPFSLRFKILFLCTNFALYEYVVMARNYGISMLFMFILAIVATNKRLKSHLTGPCLFVLCNINVHSVIVSVSYIFGLILESIKDKTILLQEKRKFLLKTSSYTIVGTVICLLTIFPTFDTAATRPLSEILTIGNLKNALFISRSFGEITYASYFGPKEKDKIHLIDSVDPNPENKDIYPLLIDNPECMDEYFSKKYTTKCVFDRAHKIKTKVLSVSKFIFTVFCSILMYVSVFSFYGELSLFSSAVLSLFSLSFFFSFFYAGGYRHQAIWLAFMIALLWISKRNNYSFGRSIQRIRSFGYSAFIVLLVLQIWPAIYNAYNGLFGTPSSNSKQFAQFMENNNSIKNSVIISSNDFYIVEAIHYYNNAPTFIISENKFAFTIPVSIKDNSSYSLDDILKSANAVAFCNHVPVLILLMNAFSAEQRVLPEKITHPTLYQFAGLINFYINPEQLARLQAQTRKIATFKETLLEPGFSVYQLLPQDAHPQKSCPSQYIFDPKMFSMADEK
ncbi:MAG: hypothetical protein ABF636_06025 [Acetobacter sp.]